MQQKMKYLRSCVTWPKRDVHCDGGLCDMIDQAREVTRETFLRNVDSDDLIVLEKGLGYERNAMKGLTMASDCYVEYYRSKLHGKRVYFLRWSAIEYVFVPPDFKMVSGEAQVLFTQPKETGRFSCDKPNETNISKAELDDVTINEVLRNGWADSQGGGEGEQNGAGC